MERFAQPVEPDTSRFTCPERAEDFLRPFRASDNGADSTGCAKPSPVVTLRDPYRGQRTENKFPSLSRHATLLASVVVAVGDGAGGIGGLVAFELAFVVVVAAVEGDELFHDGDGLVPFTPAEMMIVV